MVRSLIPGKTGDLLSKVRSLKSELLLAGQNVGRDVIFAPNELGNTCGSVYNTIIIPADVDTYYYARPLTRQPLFRFVNCRLCLCRVKLSVVRWIVLGESVPICENCYTEGGY